MYDSCQSGKGAHRDPLYKEREDCVRLVAETLSMNNIKATKLLLQFYAEETEDLIKYRYHALLADESFPTAACLFERILQEEAYHCKTVGGILLSAGINPVPPARIHIPTVSISTKSNRPSSFLNKMIESDIRDEMEGYEKYSRAAASLPSEFFELANLFSYFAEDELMHKKALASLMIKENM
jgi:rubrerythrin